jgi:DNA-binding transcriptional MerR regulator
MERYHSISEAAQMLGINISNLRYWETEFKQLKPKRSRGGTRRYSAEDMDVIRQIIYLTETQKLTLEGAKRKLAEKNNQTQRNAEIAETLKLIKNDLKEIIKLMDNE